MKALTDMPPSKTKKEVKLLLGIINYLGKFSPNTAEVWESLRKLTTAKTERIWNATFQNMFDKANAIIKEVACMQIYDETKLLCIEKDASGVGLGPVLL